MPNDSDFVRLAAATYDESQKWDFLWAAPASMSDVWVALKRFPDCDVVAFRGSQTAEDWFRDFKAHPFEHAVLGNVETGFMEGIDEVANQLAKTVRQPAYFVGHSLGAARATLCGALFTAAGQPPAGIACFGSPRSGYQKLTDILAPVPVHLFKNKHDIVTDVPNFLYRHVRGEIMIDEEPVDHGLLCRHHIFLYRQGVDKLVAALDALEGPDG